MNDTVFNKPLNYEVGMKADGKEICVVVEGSQASVAASAGEYVIVRNSTISGVTDGLYKATKNIQANTDIDDSYLSSDGMSNGVANALRGDVDGNAVDITAICQVITGTTNNTGHTINSGEYFIANGGKYKATASIPVDQTWSDKSSAVSDNDLINALNSKITTKTDVVNYGQTTPTQPVTITGLVRNDRVLFIGSSASDDCSFLGIVAVGSGNVVYLNRLQAGSNVTITTDSGTITVASSGYVLVQGVMLQKG